MTGPGSMGRNPPGIGRAESPIAIRRHTQPRQIAKDATQGGFFEDLFPLEQGAGRTAAAEAAQLTLLSVRCSTQGCGAAGLLSPVAPHSKKDPVSNLGPYIIAQSTDVHAARFRATSSIPFLQPVPARCSGGLASCIYLQVSAPMLRPCASRTCPWNEQQTRMLLQVSFGDACGHRARSPGSPRSFYYRTFFRSKNRLRYHSCHPATEMHTSNEKTLNHATLELVASLRSLISASLFFMSSI
mmetsp:Transcript_9530/g.58093  ORF Transcript_9530/g.58093 Transcript_9530/m.58093 type:complete len:242 (-) Transcript_9530:557-1282(-)